MTPTETKTAIAQSASRVEQYRRQKADLDTFIRREYSNIVDLLDKL